MADIPRQSDPTNGFEPDLVHGFAYCPELPPDVPPGMTLNDWRHAHHHGARRHHHHLRRDIFAHARSRTDRRGHLHRRR
jgi:hypothetical protein